MKYASKGDARLRPAIKNEFEYPAGNSGLFKEIQIEGQPGGG
jgi:hypothetical protein